MTTVAAVNLFITSSLVTKRTQHSTAHTQSPETGNAVHSTPANCSSFTSLISSHCLFVFYFFRLLFFVGGRFSSKKKKQKEKLNEKEDMMSTKFSNGSHQQPRKSTSLPPSSPSPCCLIDAQKCPLFVVVFSF